MFAKIYETEETGQVLMKVDQGDEGPEVRFYFVPEGLGVCSMAMQYKDTGEGWEKADKFFEEMTEDRAIEFAKGMMQKIADAT
jgi:hypothetical protein